MENKKILDIKFGPAGLGSVNDAIETLENYHKLGLRACEIAFTYGIYIKSIKDAREIGKVAKNLGIDLSIHAPYWINLNSNEKIKIEASKKRIIDCCKIGEELGAKVVVFHAGFFGKMNKEESYQNIKNAILDILNEIKKNKLKIKIAPETMGKINVFGSIDEISRLAQETGCSFTIDFAHILARYKQDMFDEVIEKFPQKNWHCHFSGIEYNEKGERRHIDTNDSDWEKLLKILIKLDKNITIINESPDPIKCAKMGVNFLN
jgi:deoxyribonuclease-4